MSDTDQIRKLNDHARQHFVGCRVTITAGIQSFDDATVAAVLGAVQAYDAFTADNDPYAEHDFGSVTVAGHTVFWKFDYYDLDLTMHSPDPSDPTVTLRVLTIMLAEEY
jgi:hypothetical protein